MVDGESLIDPSIIPDNVELIHFNILFAHLLRITQAMSHFQIKPAQHNTVTALLDRFRQNVSTDRCLRQKAFELCHSLDCRLHPHTPYRLHLNELIRKPTRLRTANRELGGD